MVIAAATDIGVLERDGFFGVLQESAVEACFQDRTDRGDGAGTDGDTPLAGRIDTLRSIDFDQRQHTQTGPEPLLGAAT